MNPLFLVSGLGMMALALGGVAYWRQRWKVGVVLFLWGALAWVVGIVLKSIAAVPVPAVIDSVRAALPSYLSEPTLWLYIGLLTGIFECGVVLGVAHIRRIRSTDWREAVGFGLGFGATEAFLLGVYSFTTILLIILIPDQLPPELLQLATSQGASLWIVPAPIVDRAIAILVHALSCVLIIYAVQTREWKWFWLSFLYKTVLDAIAGFVQITVDVQSLTVLGTWAVELAALPLAIAGLWGLQALRRRWPRGLTPAPARDEIAQAQFDPSV